MADPETDDFHEITTAKPELSEAVVPETPIVPASPEAKPAPGAAEGEHRVPLQELLAERRNRQALEADLAVLRREREQERAERERREREGAKKPDLFEDPNAFVRQEMDQGLQRDRQAAVYNAKLIAEARFTEEKVSAAQAAFDAAVLSGQIHPAEHARVLNSPNPFAEAVKWHQEHTVRTTVGGDLDAYEKKLRAKLLADPEFRKEADAMWRQQAQGSPGVIKPAFSSTPSLGRVGASALEAAAGDDEDDATAFKNITARKRK